MRLVAAYACSHAGLIHTRRGLGPPEQEEAVYRGYGTMGEQLRAARPDALLVFATDHQSVYKLDHTPAFTIGVSERARGLGDAGIPERDYPINQRVAVTLLEGAIEAGVDLAFSEDMAIDHSFVTPLLLAFGDESPPIVPVIQNCNVPPRPTLRRSHEVGRVLGDVLAAAPGDGGVAVIGSGGLSHWVGSAERQEFMRRPAGTRLARMADYPVELGDTGPINDDFDRRFLDLVGAGGWEEVATGWSDEDIEKEAGNGALEIRNWLSAAGMAADAPAETLAYEPIPQWLTGTAVVRLRL